MEQQTNLQADTNAEEAPNQQTESSHHNNTSRISTFLRVKPVSRPTSRLLLEPLDGTVEFRVPRDLAAGPVNNSRERYSFSFDGILTPEAKQDEVFERVAQPVVVSTLEGYNGTVFAYGQTGSGKTFTITGGAERYVDRGVIPRTISSIFKELSTRTNFTYQVYISYLEIYNEVGYDLLDPTREVQAMEDLPQVSIMEDEDQNIHFKNLSVHRAASEEEALNLLFLGDTNRTISETPMNQASSRSHCIFTISLEARQAGSDVVRHSKLHLVDLAGSERVSKTGVDGTTLKEAKYINLSLHYLEQVIIALQERSMGLARVHVPYRNSLMTLVLRDSLGGNCKTVMVATVSGEAAQMEESISTCRFAQRVALVTNEVSLNESVDPTVIIARLKQEVRDLKEEVALLKGNAPQRGPLTADELARLRQQLLAFVDDPGGGASSSGGSNGGSSAGLNFGGDMMMIRASWQVFKQLVLEGRSGTNQQVSPAADTAAAAQAAGDTSSSHGGSKPVVDADAGPGGSSQVQALQDQLRKLRLQVQQRDNEIALMINMLKGRGSAAAPSNDPPTSSSNSRGASKGLAASAEAADTAAASDAAGRGPDSGGGVAPVVLSALLDASLLSDRHKAFEVFRQSYRQGQVIDDNKLLLKAKYDEAKALGEAVNASKARINELKGHIELWRAQRAAACVSEGRDPAAELTEDDPREQKAKHQIEQEKASYKAAFTQLRGLKGEIEHLQLLLEQSRKKLQQDFQQWLGMVARQQQQAQLQPDTQTSGADASSTSSSSGRDGVDVAAASSGSLSRPNSARQYGRSISSKVNTDLLPGQQSSVTSSLGSGVPRPSSSSRWALRKTASAVTGGSLLAEAADQISALPAALNSSRSSQSGLDLSRVDPKLLAAAAPHLTGNPEADADIIRFYEAKEKLLQMKLGAGAR